MLAGYETTRFKSKASPTASKLAEMVVIGSGRSSMQINQAVDW